ncbi:reverse transcriptase domain, Reverse transcriptase zinc-binding domain protein [Artemisia annua]|uniref:Reverse transcriptase domain, Reverse transcriptase zinc-binding domain protein n=1 Tax=Artemisia annua TaxID=35608 RepID=A0A2U1KR71_ARTAN|nr:reverse transcriptase domain, Reverse transcriptase zinc-binding domain protein [Artemisia annua]
MVWDKIRSLVSVDDGFRVVGGDFNSVRDSVERRNSYFNAAETNEFNDFVDDAGLHEFTLKGRKFTYLAGGKMSRIDRIFVDWDFLNEWPNAEYRVLKREESDHFPLLLKVVSRNFGAKPFKFFNSWLQRDGFDEVIKDTLDSVDVDGDPDVKLLRKFKMLRTRIKEWKYMSMRRELEETDLLHTEINELERILEERDLSEEECWTLQEANSSSTFTGTWTKVVNNGTRLKVGEVNSISMIRGRLGNGRNIRFWIDPWVSRSLLKSLFPDLFSLESNKGCKVGDRLYGEQWIWKRPLNAGSESDQLQACLQLIEGQVLEESNDRWYWDRGTDGRFSVFEVKKWIDSGYSSTSNALFTWSKWVPIKCNIFMWRMLMDRIPTKQALARRNINCGDGLCTLCEDQEESVDHLFSACTIANGVWSGIARWLKLQPFFFFSVADIVQEFKSSSWSPSKRLIIKGIMIIACWRIWKARNEKIFKNERRNVTEIIVDIKVLSFLWFSNRCKQGTMGWMDWQSFSFDVM